MPVQVLHGIRSNANSLRAILPPPIPPRRVHRLWRHNFRFILLFVGFFLCTFLSNNANLFNFTMICLDPNDQNEANISQLNFQHMSNISMANFERQYPMWAMAFGTLFATIPFVHLYSLFGARRVLFIAALLSTISTALCPFAISYGSFWALSSLRFIQGISYAADFGALGMLCAQWAALDEHGIFLSIISSYSPASISIGNFLSGLFCSSPYFGWPSIYYLCSFCSLLIAFVWLALYSDQPLQSSQVTPKELEFIQKGKSTAHVGIDSAKKVPYLAILCSGLIWICWLNAFADLVSAMFMLQYKPQYFKYVLGYSVFDTGWLTAIPSAPHIPLKLSFGLASDRIKFISERHKLMLFNTIAVGLPGLSYLGILRDTFNWATSRLGIAFAPFPILSFLCFLSASIFLSAAGGGFYKCATLSSRQFGHFVMAGIQLNKCLSIFVGPALITAFVHNFDDQRQWRNIFIIFAILSLTANILFCLVATDQPAEFTNKRKMTMEEEERGNYARRSCPHFSIGEE